MSEFVPEPTPEHHAFIAHQPVFFVATAAAGSIDGLAVRTGDRVAA